MTGDGIGGSGADAGPGGSADAGPETGGAGRRGRGCCLAAAVVLAIVAFCLYWVSPLHDPENVGAAKDRTVQPAATLELALGVDFNSPNGGFSLGNEGTFAYETSRFDGIVLDVRSQVVREDGGGPDRRDIDVDVALEGSAQPKFSFGGESATTVRVCYRYSWQGHVYTIEHHVVDCPPGLSRRHAASYGAKPASTASPSGPEDPDDPFSVMEWQREAAQRVYALSGSGDAPTEAGVRALLRKAAEAGVEPDAHRSVAVRDGVAVFALGALHGCVFGAVDSQGTHVWAAPWQAPCTADRAFQGYALTKWPPVPSS